MTEPYSDLTSAKIIADSLSTAGARLTTFEVVFPRWLLPEVATHRMVSKNSASTRAIPTEQLIQKVKEHPFVPVFRERVAGMGVGGALSAYDQATARALWMESCDAAVAAAEQLVKLRVDKSRAGRLLEPFMWHTVIMSATSWGNMFALRCPPSSEPDPTFPSQLEFQTLSIAMRTAYQNSIPRILEPGQWHLPYVSDEERLQHEEDGILAALSAGRNARVSYMKHADDESNDRTLKRASDLAESGHYSPLEHPAEALADPMERSGNFTGFKQYRSFFPGEHNAALRRPDLDWLTA